jgi:hypothetical protein
MKMVTCSAILATAITAIVLVACYLLATVTLGVDPYIALGTCLGLFGLALVVLFGERKKR